MESNCTDQIIDLVTESDKLRKVVFTIVEGEVKKQLKATQEAIDLIEEDLEDIEDDITKTNARIGRLEKKVDDFIKSHRRRHFWDRWF